MLGYLRMNVDQALDAILTIVSAVFPYDPEAEITAETNTRNLVAAVEDMLQAIGVPLDTRLHDKRLANPKCKVYVFHWIMFFLLTLPKGHVRGKFGRY